MTLCSSRKRDARPCGNLAITGSRFCRYHGRKVGLFFRVRALTTSRGWKLSRPVPVYEKQRDHP